MIIINDSVEKYLVVSNGNYSESELRLIIETIKKVHNMNCMDLGTSFKDILEEFGGFEIIDIDEIEEITV